MYAIVIIAADGTISAAGPVRDEYRAVLAADQIETEESGLTAHVRPLENLEEVLKELA
jgi:hypothetical protein